MIDWTLITIFVIVGIAFTPFFYILGVVIDYVICDAECDKQRRQQRHQDTDGK